MSNQTKQAAPTIKPRLVQFNGTQVIEGWPEKVEEAQRQTYAILGKKRYNRIPYGQGILYPKVGPKPCHDCCAMPGQLHVHGCDMEECPKCHGQFFICGCW